jgi:hypothetical protein
MGNGIREVNALLVVVPMIMNMVPVVVTKYVIIKTRLTNIIIYAMLRVIYIYECT